MIRATTKLPWLLAAAGVSLLAACGAASDAAGGPSPTPTTAAPVTTDPVTTEPSTTAPVTTEPSTPSATSCLIGDWIISDADLGVYFDTVSVNAGFRSIDSTGVIRLTFTDTGYEWNNDYSLSMMVADTLYQAAQSGGISGTYSEAAGVLTGTVDRDDRTSTFSQDGAPLAGDVGDLFVGINPGHPMDSLPYSCDGPTLTLAAGPLAGAQYPVRLTPV